MALSSEISQHPFTAGQWRIDPVAREATDGVRTRRLSPRAMQVLLHLLDARGDVVRRSELLDAVWPGVHVGDESLTQAVAELRRALGRSPQGHRLIETVPKAGYRLTALDTGGVHANLTHAQAPGSGLLAVEPVLPLEAHLAITEAHRLARYQGVPAAPEIERLAGEAVAIAPDAGSVRAQYAALMGLAAMHAGDRPRRLALAATSAEQAVRLRPDLVASHRALGFVAGVQGLMDLSLKSFSCALTIDPDDFETHYLAAQVCFVNGDLAKSMILGERAAELDPDDYRPAYNAARAAMQLGDQERGARLSRLALTRIEAQLALAPGTRRLLSARAAASAMVGSASESVDVTLDRAADSALLYDVITLVHQGEISSACLLLENIIDHGWSFVTWLYSDPVIEVLRPEPRFARLTNRLQAA